MPDPFDFQKTIISEYDNSASLVQLITNFAGYIDPSRNFDAFYDLIWNVDTAEGYGLDVWGRIVGVGRQLLIPSPQEYLGFVTGDDSWEPFNQAPFYNGQPITENYTLADGPYRLLILVKAAANIACTDIPTLNRLMRQLFESSGLRAYVNDLGNMQMRYTFEGYLEPWQFAVITQSGVMPRPTGVGVYIMQTGEDTFGFAEAGDAEPFGHGTFFNGGNLINAS